MATFQVIQDAWGTLYISYSSSPYNWMTLDISYNYLYPAKLENKLTNVRHKPLFLGYFINMWLDFITQNNHHSNTHLYITLELLLVLFLEVIKPMFMQNKLQFTHMKMALLTKRCSFCYAVHFLFQLSGKFRNVYLVVNAVSNVNYTEK